MLGYNHATCQSTSEVEVYVNASLFFHLFIYSLVYLLISYPFFSNLQKKKSDVST